MDFIRCMDNNVKNQAAFTKRKTASIMMQFKKIIGSLLLVLLSLSSNAQEKEVQMGDMMRDNGRIYVVVAVVLTILIGLILYVIRLDKKITRLEKEK